MSNPFRKFLHGGEVLGGNTPVPLLLPDNKGHKKGYQLLEDDG